MSDDIAAWLLEQIDADERAAREVGRPGDNSSDLFHCWVTGGEGLAETGMVDISPARVLAECEAKRRIVHLARRYAPTEYRVPMDQALRILASVYADRPGYDESWCP